MIKSKMQYGILLSAIGGILIGNQSAMSQDSVEYEFEWIAEWSAQTHPMSFPGNPHFSPVIGANHTDAISIWGPGEIASNGIEVMAETGSPSTLQNEVLTHIANGHAEQFHNLGPIQNSPGSRVRTLTMNKDFPLMSLVTMIAPSPDWFVGVHDIDMRPNGIWAQELVFDVFPYDSGTDSGVNYTSGNSDISPHLPTANISDDFPFNGTQRIGTFRFTLLTPAACSIADLAEPYNELNFFDVSAFLNAFQSNDAVADLNDDGEFNFFDVSTFLNSFTQGCP